MIGNEKNVGSPRERCTCAHACANERAIGTLYFGGSGGSEARSVAEMRAQSDQIVTDCRGIVFSAEVSSFLSGVQCFSIKLLQAAAAR